MKMVVPISVLVECRSPQQAAAMAAEIGKLIKEPDVLFAIQGAGVRSGAEFVDAAVGQPVMAAPTAAVGRR